MERAGATPIVGFPEGEEVLEYYGLRGGHVAIKDESQNPTGTYKDRRSTLIVERAAAEKVNKLAIISAGNAAYSLAQSARERNIEVIPIVDEKLSPAVKEGLSRTCWRVVEADLSVGFLDSQRLERMTRESPAEKIWDVSNGFHTAYEGIVDELPEPPDTIIVPVGSGEAMMGIMDGLYRKGWKTRVIGVLSLFDERLRTNYRPYDDAIKRHSQPHILFVHVYEFSDEKAKSWAPEYLRTEPAARIVFGALLNIAHVAPGLLGERILLINSGCGKILDEARESTGEAVV